MNNNEFYQLSEQLMTDLESILDAYMDKNDVDIDYETHGNVLTISFENNSKIILNTQEPLHQIWLATRKQGYHFDYVDGQWVCTRSGATLMNILNAALDDQSR
ncbi:iron donor protein CyaY [Zophobihabitans entericus]|uniref:Iron-sulfur cluster assembly protein CyaY n=1 Tax=Zophobihabitans entericus TaxID=1635327 RepID=A0A6G9IDQ0_9GAMM|nr:iron donor protein CyaY [Zophobihabitans entericus]QIQ21939.1 iron donor protein CyaY [Zophobihabitans entericus]